MSNSSPVVLSIERVEEIGLVACREEFGLWKASQAIPDMKPLMVCSQRQVAFPNMQPPMVLSMMTHSSLGTELTVEVAIMSSITSRCRRQCEEQRKFSISTTCNLNGSFTRAVDSASQCCLPGGVIPNLFVNKLDRCTLNTGDAYRRFRSAIRLSTCSFQRTMMLSCMTHRSDSKETVAFGHTVTENLSVDTDSSCSVVTQLTSVPHRLSAIPRGRPCRVLCARSLTNFTRGSTAGTCTTSDYRNESQTFST